MSEILKPCPFCGGEPHECLDNHFDCLNRGCPMAGARAIPLEDWNTRPIEDDLRNRIAELEEYIGQLIEASKKIYSWASFEDYTAFYALVDAWKEREE